MRTSATDRRRTYDGGGAGGFAALEFALGLAVLLLPVALVVVSLPVWAETQSMGRVAAQQAARAAALAPDAATATGAATAAAATVVANHGRSLRGPVQVVVESGAPQPQVRATVTVDLPALNLPLLRRVTSVDWRVSATQPLDLYRSLP